MAVMTIISAGLDATEISRVQDLLTRYGDRFRHRIYTAGEIAYCERRRTAAESYAARFAAKEAAMKALGTGRSRGVLWRDIEVVRAPGGPPQLRFHGEAGRRFTAIGGVRSILTLTHAKELALAQVLFLGE
jgi:holo-[acyl-carrier protein] synthase